MKRCPTCNKQVQWQDNPFRPFCSERCKLVDLDKWVSDEYRVPGKAVPTEPDEQSESENVEETESAN
jgi:endogenous inhibitor of DNA gyrase (YacG/DUF329 family)